MPGTDGGHRCDLPAVWVIQGFSLALHLWTLSHLGRAVGGGSEQLGPGRWMEVDETQAPQDPAPASTSATSVENGFG